MPKGVWARPRPSIEVRFWAKVALPDDELRECWLWHGDTNAQGYGLLFDRYRGDYRDGGKVIIRAHRFAYELIVGPIPDGLTLDHLCRVRNCVNPAHLEPVTQAENVRRGLSGINTRSRTHCPQGHPYSGDNLYVRPSKPQHRVCRACKNKSRTVATARVIAGRGDE